ncbi:unnamed protein product [Coffea canephora]|uniref:Precursor of CEP14 n=1 Tax=Coffea canephora TaxID=49390 RepID=A0A068TKX7_COFCA|nr:unnamed protein product [Coffea canephora]
MASSRIIMFVLLVALLNFVSCSCGRKMLEVQELDKNMAPPQHPLDARLYLTSLPKGKVPASTPSKKGHSVTVDEKLVARHLAAIDRILRSVPSPGVGH